jgi:rhamnulokinase
MRRIIANSIDIVTYHPQNKAEWDVAYEKYLKVTNQ